MGGPYPSAKYQPVHVEQECLCSTHEFENQDAANTPVTEIYEKGRVPLVRIFKGSVELLSYKYPKDEELLFVAISHVRSDGLGNSYSNSLPMCQLSRLQRLANLALPDHPHVPFWIDTACIPRTRAGNVIALEKLGYIFRGAKAVLALDNSILKLKHTSASGSLLRIRDCQWANRLWTIREGAQARCLLFLIGDLIKDMDNALLIHKCDIKEQNKNQRFLDFLLLFERDIRVAIGRTPDAQMPQYVEMDYDELKDILHVCYQCTLRYREICHKSGCLENVNDKFEKLYKLLSSIYKGISYKSLVQQQKESLDHTLLRLRQICNYYKTGPNTNLILD